MNTKDMKETLFKLKNDLDTNPDTDLSFLLTELKKAYKKYSNSQLGFHLRNYYADIHKNYKTNRNASNIQAKKFIKALLKFIDRNPRQSQLIRPNELFVNIDKRITDVVLENLSNSKSFVEKIYSTGFTKFPFENS